MMADIVISHATEDRDRAEILGRALSAQGLKVWMYRDILGGGGDRDEVNAKIRDAARVIALWTPAGCASKWVLEEARAAAEDHRLINIELLSGLTPRAFQAGLRIDLSGWEGQRNDPSLEPVAQAIATIVGKEERQAEKRRGGLSALPGKIFGRESASARVEPAHAESVNAAAPEPAAGPGTAEAAPAAPLKIEVFEQDKPSSTPEGKTRRWYDLSPARMFVFGLIFSVAIGAAVLAVRNSFNSHPIAVAARAAAEQDRAAAEEPELDAGFAGDPDTVKFLKELGSSAAPLTAIAYGSNEWLQAIGDANGSLRLIEADDGTLYSTLTTGGKAITRVAFDGGAEYVAATSVDGKLYVFRAGDGAKTEFTIGGSPVRALAWHPSDVLIATGDDSGMLDVRSLLGDDKTLKKKFDSPITALAWRGDGAVIALGFKSGAIQHVDARTGEVLFRSAGHLGQVNALAYSPDRTTLASVGEDGVTKTWNADTGEGFLKIPSRPCTPEELDKEGHCPGLAVVFSSPNGEVLLTSNQKGDVEGYNPRTGERVVRIRGHKAPVTGVGWSRYDHRITTIDAAGKAAFWTSPFDKPWNPGGEAE